MCRIKAQSKAIWLCGSIVRLAVMLHNGSSGESFQRLKPRNNDGYEQGMNNRGWSLRVGEQRGTHLQRRKEEPGKLEGWELLCMADVINNDWRLSEKRVIFRPEAPDTAVVSQLSWVNASSHAHTHFNERIMDVNSSYKTENWGWGRLSVIEEMMKWLCGRSRLQQHTAAVTHRCL